MEEKKPSDLEKKTITAAEPKIREYKKHYLIQKGINRGSLALFGGATLWISYKKKTIPFVDITGYSLFKISKKNNIIKKIDQLCSFNHRVYLDSPLKLLFSPENLFPIATATGLIGIPKLANKQWKLPELNDKEAQAIKKAEDPFLEYVRPFSGIPITTQNLTEYCLSIAKTDTTVALSQEQKKAFYEEIIRLYAFSYYKTIPDILTNTDELKKLEDAIKNLKTTDESIYFKKNEKQNTFLDDMVKTIKNIQTLLTEENKTYLDFLKKLEIQKQMIANKRNKEEKEEEEEFNIKNTENIKILLEKKDENLEKQAKQINSAIKKIKERCKDLIKDQKKLFEDIYIKLQEEEKVYFEEAWKKLTEMQHIAILEQIINEKEHTDPAFYFGIQTLAPQNATIIPLLHHQIKAKVLKKEQKTWKQTILFYIKRALPGHKIHDQIQESISKAITKITPKHGIELHINQLEQLPTAELQNQYQKIYFKDYTENDYKTYFEKKEKDITLKTLAPLIKSHIFQAYIISNLELFSTKTLIELERHSPFLFHLIVNYTTNKEQEIKTDFTQLESFLSSIIKTQEDLHLPIELIIALSHYVEIYHKNNTKRITDIIDAANKDEQFNQRWDYLVGDENIKTQFSIPSKPEEE